MEIKKNPKADLRNWKGIFLEGGLIIALVVCITAFSISQKDKVIVLKSLDQEIEITELIDVTQQQEEQQVEPPKAVAVMADLFEVVKNDTKIDTDFTIWEFDTEIPVMDLVITPEEIDEGEVFFIAEDMPSFQGGGLAEFRTWVQKNYAYPQIAADMGIQGNVTVFFVVEKNGSVSNIRVMQSPDPILSEEAVKTISKSPTWTPGKNRGQPVRIQYSLTFMLRLN